MTNVEIKISTEGPGGYELLEVASTGSLASALRACLLRVGDRFNTDADVQRLVDAVAQAVPR